MAENTSGRIEPHTMLVGLGMGVTRERITELEERARQVEKQTRPKPTEAFSAVMSRRTVADAAAPHEPSAKEQKLEALPKKGPRPSLVHPAQRQAFGRDGDEQAEPVIIKG